MLQKSQGYSSPAPHLPLTQLQVGAATAYAHHSPLGPNEGPRRLTWEDRLYPEAEVS